MKSLILGLCVLVAVTSVANAETYTWDGTVGNAWEDPTHWNPAGGPPTLTDGANLLSGTCNVLTTGATAQTVLIGFGIENLTTTVNVNAGATLSTSSEVVAGFYAGTNSTAIVNVYGTGLLSSLRVAGEQVGSTGSVNIDGGLCNVTAFGTYIGTNWEDYDELVTTVPVSKGVGTVNIDNGGVFQIDGWGANSNVLFNNRFDVAANGSAINILDAASVFKVLGDCQTYMQTLMDDGRITGRDVAWFDAADGYTYAIPEPTTMILLGLGGLLLRRKRA